MTTLDIGGTNVTATAAELNIMDGVTATTAELNIMDGVTATTAELNIMDGVTATTAELNLMDGGTSASSTTLAAADRLIVNDNGTMKQVALSDFETFFESALDTTSNITTVGALDSGSITSGFGNIDTGSSTITTTGLITGGSLDIDDVVINGTTIGHTDDTDLMTVANGVLTVAGEVSMTTLDIGGTNVTSTAAELNILDGVTSTAAELNILDGVTSTAAELNILDGVTSTAAELNILDGVTATTAELNYSDTGASVGTVVASKVVTVDANKDVASFRNITLTGELDAGSLDVSGDADIDGTLEADAITVNGTALNTVIANEATALAIALG
jgi:cytoskeletal protein CcmA (bactofilin family)